MAEMSDYCNAACPMCNRYDWDLNLVKGVTNQNHTTLEFVKENPNIFSDIKKLIDERNIVAHYLLDTSEAGKSEYINNGKIGFVKFRNSTETLWRTQEMYLNFHLMTSNNIKLLSTLLTT